MHVVELVLVIAKMMTDVITIKVNVNQDACLRECFRPGLVACRHHSHAEAKASYEAGKESHEGRSSFASLKLHVFHVLARRRQRRVACDPPLAIKAKRLVACDPARVACDPAWVACDLACLHVCLPVCSCSSNSCVHV